MDTPSLADARLDVHRRLVALFVEVLAQDPPSAEETDAAVALADMVIEELGLQVEAVDEDGSIAITVT